MGIIEEGLLKKGKRLLAKFLLDKTEDLLCFVAPEEVLKVYGNNWSANGMFKGLGSFVMGGLANNDHFGYLINAAEIGKKLKTFIT